MNKTFFVTSPAVPHDLAEEVSSLVKLLREKPEKGVHTEMMQKSAVKTARIILLYYYLRPAEYSHLSSFGKKMTQIGINTGLGILSRVSKTIFGNMSGEQLVLFADYLEDLFFQRKADEQHFFNSPPLPPELVQKTLDIIDRLRHNPVPRAHTAELTESLRAHSCQITDYYFMRSIYHFGIGSFGRKLAEMGKRQSLVLTEKMGKKVFKQMTAEQLLLFADYLESSFFAEEGP